eukprot:365197-Chlamydomonas_euryale.AAC.10
MATDTEEARQAPEYTPEEALTCTGKHALRVACARTRVRACGGVCCAARERRGMWRQGCPAPSHHTARMNAADFSLALSPPSQRSLHARHWRGRGAHG